MRSRRAPTDEERALYGQAEDARLNAYAPYSDFAVGAALRTSTLVVTAANFENASYGLTICAERAAVGRAIGEGMASEARKLGAPKKALACITAIAVATPANTGPPCGACRQVLAEFAADGMRVVYRHDGELCSVQLVDLLPERFVL